MPFIPTIDDLELMYDGTVPAAQRLAAQAGSWDRVALSAAIADARATAQQALNQRRAIRARSEAGTLMAYMLDDYTGLRRALQAWNAQKRLLRQRVPKDGRPSAGFMLGFLRENA